MQTKILKRVAIASDTIPGFSMLLEDVYKSMLLNGLSKNTFDNYSRKLADISLRFNKLPSKISEQEMKDYLAEMIQGARNVSRSEFKHTIYGLRYYLKMIGEDMNIKLPNIKKDKRLPIVLSKDECRSIFELTTNIKHRAILMFIYSAGLRVSELINMKWSCVDVDRMSILIKRSKGNKDRYVPLSEYLLSELLAYIKIRSKGEYVFSGGLSYKKMSASGISFLMQQAVKRASINKEGVCLHTLRHSFATHLLEDGIDIVSIMELLGHSRLETTLVYLHVAYQPQKKRVSPLDSLMRESFESDLDSKRREFNELTSRRDSLRKQVNCQLDIFEGREESCA